MVGCYSEGEISISDWTFLLVLIMLIQSTSTNWVKTTNEKLVNALIRHINNLNNYYYSCVLLTSKNGFKG